MKTNPDQLEIGGKKHRRRYFIIILRSKEILTPIWMHSKNGNIAAMISNEIVLSVKHPEKSKNKSNTIK